jgi:flavin reductase (DIM6/NTAB) family NADH-FMN oxidoreductase RutF
MSATTVPAWAAALGKIPSGLFILTVADDPEPTGLLVSWVQQCSFDPPQITVAIRPERHVSTLLTNETSFVLNQLASGQKNLLSHFGKGFNRGEPAFAGIATRSNADGVPIIGEALGYLDCFVVGRVSAGDHDLIIGQIDGGQLLTEGHAYVHFRRNGLNY